MPQFRYEARERNGSPVTGLIEAQNRGHALVLLRERGLAVDALADARTQQKEQMATWGQGPLYPLWPIRASSLALFFDQLGRLLSAGVTPHEACAALEERVGGRLRRVAREGAATFARGGTISSHLERYPRFFAPHVVGIFRAGERSGQLPDACREIVRQYETDMKVGRHVLLLKAYLVVMLLPCVFIPSFPHIISKAYEANPNQTWTSPTLQQVLDYLRPGLEAYFGHVLRAILPWLIGAWVGLKVGTVVANLPALRPLRDRLAFSVPPVSLATRRAAVARFSRVMELMQRAAAPIAESVREASRATGNLFVAERAAAPAAALDRGGRVSDVFRATGLFSPSQVSLLTTAEETGTLEEALGQLAERTRNERENFLKAAQWGGCATAFILGAIATFFAAVAGWTTVYSEIYKVFESPSWNP